MSETFLVVLPSLSKKLLACCVTPVDQLVCRGCGCRVVLTMVGLLFSLPPSPPLPLSLTHAAHVNKPHTCCGLAGFVSAKVGWTWKGLSRDIGATAPRHCDNQNKDFAIAATEAREAPDTSPTAVFPLCCASILS